MKDIFLDEKPTNLPAFSAGGAFVYSVLIAGVCYFLVSSHTKETREPTPARTRANVPTPTRSPSPARPVERRHSQRPLVVHRNPTLPPTPRPRPTSAFKGYRFPRSSRVMETASPETGSSRERRKTVRIPSTPTPPPLPRRHQLSVPDSQHLPRMENRKGGWKETHIRPGADLVMTLPACVLGLSVPVRFYVAIGGNRPKTYAPGIHEIHLEQPDTIRILSRTAKPKRILFRVKSDLERGNR